MDSSDTALILTQKNMNSRIFLIGAYHFSFNSEVCFPMFHSVHILLKFLGVKWKAILLATILPNVMLDMIHSGTKAMIWLCFAIYFHVANMTIDSSLTNKQLNQILNIQNDYEQANRAHESQYRYLQQVNPYADSLLSTLM